MISPEQNHQQTQFCLLFKCIEFRYKY